MDKFEKYRSIEKFKNLDSLKVIDKDNNILDFKEKFKDFQEIYSIIIGFYRKNNYIQWINSNNQKISYIFAQKILATNIVSASGNLDYDLDKIKDTTKLKNLKFEIPNYEQLRTLKEITFLKDDYYQTYWYYLDNNKYTKVRLNSNYLYSSIYSYTLGIFNVSDFHNNLDARNIKFLQRMNTYEKSYSFIREFEIALNYDLLDEGLIKLNDDEKEKLKNLVKVYREYKKYISCIYVKDGTEDTVVIAFDDEKISASIENDKDKFNKLEITYQENYLGIIKQEIDKNKIIYYFSNGDKEEIDNSKSEKALSIYYYKNGDSEKRYYSNGRLEGESILNYKNGDNEKRYYSNGVLEGESILNYKNGDNEKKYYKNGVLEGKRIFTYKNGEIETREYKNGVLQEEALYEKDGHTRKYIYNNGIREEMPKLKYYLSIDKERINIDDYRENRLLDPNVGHWDLKEEDKEELKEILGKEVYSRDPKLDINQGGIVGIDFGTKSTVVVYQKDTNNILPMRISGEELNKEARDTDYENPTVIEFKDLVKFKKDYDEEIGRPNTKWEDVTISHVAFKHLMEGTSEQFDSIISDIKQWTVNKNAKIEVIDKKGNKISLPPYLDLDENEENYIDPVEIYAYYIGSYINTMRNGIYLEYYLSFPVTYEKAVREKILKSFEKGIKKSLPVQIQEDEKIMKKFRVKHGSNEPAAYAVCALKKLKIEPKENEKIYYGVFDFGGGTTDFDFGIWKNSEDEDKYDYELEHFGAGGDIHLGGENILKELAYKVFSNNTSKLRESKIQYVRPEWCPEISGEETLVENTREAKLNTRKLAEEKLRDIWEEKSTERIDNLSINLFNADGVLETGIDLKVNEEELKNLIKDKIEKGIKNFFIKLEDAFKDEDVKKVHIFLAGNSCRHSFVNEIFEKYVAEMKDRMELVIYDLKAIKESDNDSKITGKTGVAYGLIYSRKGGRIKVTNRDEKENVANEINFKFYLGNSKKDKFNPIITPSSNYGKFGFLGILTSDIFEIYYTTSPEAQTGKMEIGKDDPKIKRISLNEEYNEDERYRIYIKAVTPDKISYVIVKKEEDVDTKEFLEEGEVFLD